MFARFVALLLLSVPTKAQPVYYEVVATSTSGYRFNGSSFNPAITLIKGQTYGEPAREGPGHGSFSTRPLRAVFNLTAKNHPFRIIADTTAAFVQPAYTSLPECSSCVDVNDVRNGRVTFVVPTGSTSPRIGYVCTAHSVMRGNFTLVEPSQTPSASGSPSATSSSSQSETPSASSTPSQSSTPSPTVTPSQVQTGSQSATPSQVRERGLEQVATRDQHGFHSVSHSRHLKLAPRLHQPLVRAARRGALRRRAPRQ